VSGPVKVGLGGGDLLLAERGQANTVRSPPDKQHAEAKRLTPVPELMQAIAEGVNIPAPRLAKAVSRNSGRKACLTSGREAKELLLRW
jgi:hypothetical protein